jgi:hypothetical protein
MGRSRAAPQRAGRAGPAADRRRRRPPLQDRTDRELVTPWFKFLWETYRSVLEILRTNQKLEALYSMTAVRAFQFCLQYKRTAEFRRLCDILRQHMQNMHKYRERDITQPESLQLHLETRFEQLKVSRAGQAAAAAGGAAALWGPCLQAPGCWVQGRCMRALGGTAGGGGLALRRRPRGQCLSAPPRPRPRRPAPPRRSRPPTSPASLTSLTRLLLRPPPPRRWPASWSCGPRRSAAWRTSRR